MAGSAVAMCSAEVMVVKNATIAAAAIAASVKLADSALAVVVAIGGDGRSVIEAVSLLLLFFLLLFVSLILCNQQ